MWSRLVKYLGVLALLVSMHLAFYFYGAEPLARLLAPQYVSLSTAEAEAVLQRWLLAPKKLDIDAQIDCYRFNFSESAEDCISRRQLLLENKPKPTIEDVRENHRAIFHREKLQPLTEDLQNNLSFWVFGLLYAGLGLLVIRVMVQWFVGYGLPSLRLYFVRVPWTSSMRPRKAIIALRAWWVSRAYRKAAQEFDDLATLHKNDLISNEEFLKRKNALAAELKRK